MTKSKPTVLFLFNSSTYAVQPWINDGRFTVVSVDYDDTDHSGAHGSPSAGHTVLSIDLSIPYAVNAVRDALRGLGLQYPSLVVSFAPCTDLAVSGAAHFERKRNASPMFQRDAVRMARLVEEFQCPYAVENPVSVLATLWRKPCMYFHPYHFTYLCPEGPHPEFPNVIPERDLYRKKTGLWTGNGFVAPLKVEPPESVLRNISEVNPGFAKRGGKSAKTKYIRSLTPRGLAEAIYYANRESVLDTFNSQKGLTRVEINIQLDLYTAEGAQ